MITIYLEAILICWFFIVIIKLPDYFIPKLINKLKNNLGDLEENPDWSHVSKILGWIERALYGVFFFFLPQFLVIFIGIWLALKVVGSFNNWPPVAKNLDYTNHEISYMQDKGQEARNKFEYHKRRANHMIFTIGTGLSLLWVILMGLLFKFTIYLFN